MSIELLKEYANMTNIASEGGLSKDMLDRIGANVLVGFNEDYTSCTQWLKDVNQVEKLAELYTQKKSTPIPDAANIKMPLITKASFEFASRTYPEIIKDGKVVKAHIIGEDLDQEKAKRCKRVADYMNYQLLFEHDDWEIELDKLLTMLSLVGFICKKTYYDPIRNVVKSEMCDYKDLIINSNVKTLGEAPRISHVLHVKLNDLIEHSNADVFLDYPIQELIESLGDNELNTDIDLIEQHTFLDLDGDNYKEPYIVTVLKENGQVLRIAPRFDKDCIYKNTKGKIKYIDPEQLFTDYHFLVSPRAKFQSLGFGTLLLHVNETINSTLNSLMDAAKLANMQGGFKDSRLKNLNSGMTRHEPGTFIELKATQGVTIKEGIVPLEYKEPSSVMYQLLGLLIQVSKDVSSSTEVMTGATQADNAKTGAVQLLQTEGRKIFTAIQRRIYRSLSAEIQKIYKLDALYLDPKKYYNVIDEQKIVKQDDFDIKSVGILPIADPNLSSEAQRMQKNQLLFAAQQLPGVDKIKLSLMMLDNSDLGIPGKELMLPPEQLNQPAPEVIRIQAEIQSWAEDKKLKAHELEIRQQEMVTERLKVQAQIVELKAKAMFEIAQAQAQQDNGKFKEYQMQLDILQTQLGALQHAAEFNQANAMHSNEMGMKQQELDQNQQSADNEQQAQTVDNSPDQSSAAQ